MAVLMKPVGAFDRPALFAAYGRALDKVGGRYITAEDVGCTAEDMRVIRTQTPFVAGLSEGAAASGDPSPKTAKGVVKREVVRVVTAGTLTDEALLDEQSENVLAAVCVQGRNVGVADVELASGRFRAFEVFREGAIDELVRTGPAEILMPGRTFFALRATAATSRVICLHRHALYSPRRLPEWQSSGQSATGRPLADPKRLRQPLQ